MLQLARGVLVGCVILLAGMPVGAQTVEGAAVAPGGEVEAAAETSEPGEVAPDPVLVEAGERFDRGVQYYDEGDFGAALAEFLRAYELTSSWQVLYNLGQVSQSLHRRADAARYFEAYLEDGGADIDPGRRAEVEQSLAELHSRLAVLTITVDADGSVIKIDDEIVGTSPLADALYVEPGPHVVVAQHDEHGSVRQEVTLASETEETVALMLIGPTGPVGGPGPDVPPPPVEEEESIASQWWFWTIIGAVVAGGAVTAGVLLTQPETIWTEGTAGTLDLHTLEN